MKPKSKHAFTLTELLVAAPIAMLFGTMLLAVSNDATQQLKAASCLNNMRQWGLGFMLYANDYNDYFPYDGFGNYPVVATQNTNAWFNVVPKYIGQTALSTLYLAGTPPTPLTRSVWSCPSSTNVTVQPALNNAYFMYSMSVCWHEEGSTHVGFRRNRATIPPNTILFCEEPEDSWPETQGSSDTVTRHFGGSNFVFGDGHADWLNFTNFCREGNAGCPFARHHPVGRIESSERRLEPNRPLSLVAISRCEQLIAMRNGSAMKHNSSTAFSLTELLVSSPIALLLGTMLLAVSNDATQQLKAAACLNNMRQWGLGFMLYANDHNDYFPYDGNYTAGPCGANNTSAWFNVVPAYIGQKRLCDLYTAGTPPTPLTRSVWSCPSSTNVAIQPTLSNAYFMYAFTTCWHAQSLTTVEFQRNRMTSPPTTILFCEEPEDIFPETNGQYDTVTRHFGGSNFVFGDGHADWINFTNFCRQGNPGCPVPLNQIPWDDSAGGNQPGDWNPMVHYHWWPFAYANASQN